MSFWYLSAGSLPAPPVQNPTPLSCPCFKLPLFYDCKWLELKCYRQEEIVLHDLTGLNQPTQPGTRPSHNWEAQSAPSPAAGTHPMNSPGKLCLLQTRYRHLIMPGFSFFFFFKKRCLSHINDKTNFSVLLTRCCTVSCCQKELSLMRWFSWLSSSLVHEQVPNKTARAHLTPVSKGCWGGNISGAKGLELPHYKQSQKSLNPFGNTITEFHF